MKKLLALLLFPIFAFAQTYPLSGNVTIQNLPAGPQGPQGSAGPAGVGGVTISVFSNAVEDSNWILLGGPSQAYRAGLVIHQDVPMNAGDVAIVTAEGEGSIYSYPFNTNNTYSFSMFVTSQLWVFPQGMAPTITPLGTMPGGTALSPGTGMDINKAYNYYSPQVKTGSYQAPATGIYTFAMYWWGGSGDPAVGTGNSACTYPGSSKITVTLFSAH